MTVKVDIAGAYTLAVCPQNKKGMPAITYAEKPDYDDEEIEKKDLEELHSVYGILRKLDIDWKKGDGVVWVESAFAHVYSTYTQMYVYL